MQTGSGIHRAPARVGMLAAAVIMGASSALEATTWYVAVDGDDASLFAGGSNPANQDLRFFDNVWSDPTGTMGSEAYVGVDLFDSRPGGITSFVVDNNLKESGQALTVNLRHSRILVLIRGRCRGKQAKGGDNDWGCRKTEHARRWR